MTKETMIQRYKETRIDLEKRREGASEREKASIERSLEILRRDVRLFVEDAVLTSEEEKDILEGDSPIQVCL